MATDAKRIEHFKREVEEEWRNPQVTAAYRKWGRDESEWGRAGRDLVIVEYWPEPYAAPDNRSRLVEFVS